MGIHDSPGEEYQDDKRDKYHDYDIYPVTLKRFPLGFPDMPDIIEHFLHPVHHPDDKPDEGESRDDTEQA